MSPTAFADRLNDALPQTQCTRCGYPDCRGYAEAIASGEAAINRCPPGGADDAIHRAGLDAERAPDAPGLVDDGQRTRAFGATLGIKR